MILLMGTLSFLWSWKAMDLWLWKWSPEVIYCSLVCLATWELLSSQLSNLVKAFPKWKWLRFHLQVLMLKTLLTPPCSTHCASNTWSLIFFLGRPWFWEAPSLKWVSHFILGGMIFLSLHCLHIKYCQVSLGQETITSFDFPYLFNYPLSCF